MCEAQRDSLATFHSNETPQIGPRAFHSESFRSEEHLEQRQMAHSMHARNFPVANPYEERADEIGPSHRIPGIRHLGGLLTPPGWKKGDEPIDPRAARRLLDVAREEARNSLKTNLDEREQLGPETSERRREDRDWQWKSRHLLDNTLYNERVNVYMRYQRREQLRLRPETGQRHNFSQPIALRPPETVHEPATTYVTNDIHLFPNQPNLYRGSMRVNTSYSAQSQPGK